VGHVTHDNEIIFFLKSKVFSLIRFGFSFKFCFVFQVKPVDFDSINQKFWVNLAG
jgi:hypothetical protein